MRIKDGISAESNSSQDGIAKDIAHLYSWANVQDTHYRDFSKQRREQRVQSSQSAEKVESEPAPVTAAQDPSIELEPVRSSPPIEITTIPELSTATQPVRSDLTTASLDISQWFARTPLFPARELLADHPSTQSSIAIYSLAGGVGKSTLAANLAATLCSLGEETLIVDTSGLSLLPFFFGASDFKAGIRSFFAPGPDQIPVRVICSEDSDENWLESQVKPAMRASQRTIFDIGSVPEELLADIFALCSIVLVPLLPDLNSVLTIRKIEHKVASLAASGRQAPKVYYFFNEYDSAREIDQQAHAIAVQQCGKRLLQLSVRFGPENTEALAYRTTVTDLAPGCPVSHDYREIAKWLRSIVPAPRSTARWSER
jgi:cellulose biosynthesis protein BcsQ